jgi:hypothetical protein
MRRPRALVVVVLLLAVGAARGEEPAAPRDPPLCAEEIRARGGDEIAALRAAEAERWLAARRAGHRHRRLLDDHLATGPRHAPELMAESDRLSAAYTDAVREAHVLCGCRLRRGDAEPRDCERRYPIP